MNLRIRVVGVPATAGSFVPRKRKNGSLYLLRSGSQKHREWRQAAEATIRQAVRLWQWEVSSDDEYSVSLSFLLPKPKSVTRKQPNVKPDIDKLCRSTLDALTVGHAIDDDARIIQLTASKTYAAGTEQPGCYITVNKLNETKEK